MPWMPLCNVHLLAVWNYWGIVVVLVFLVLGMIVNFIFWNRCRKCKRRMAIEKTGKILIAAKEAKDYGIKDIDGKQSKPLSIDEI